MYLKACSEYQLSPDSRPRVGLQLLLYAFLACTCSRTLEWSLICFVASP